MAQPSGPGSRVSLRPARPTIRPIKGLAIDLGTWSSAVALFENSVQGRGFDPAQERALRRGLARLLQDQDLQPITDQVFEAYQDLRVQLPLDKRPGDVADAAELAAQLASREVATVLQPDVLEERRATERALERTLMDPRHAQLREKLAPRLHRMYDTVFGILPLRLHNLWVLPIRDDREGLEVSSMLAVRSDNFDDTRLLGRTADAFTEKNLVVPGIKRRLVRQQQISELTGASLPAGWQPDTDLLIGQAYRDLVRRAEDGVIAKGLIEDLKTSVDATLEQVVITFPTTLAPNARDRLRAVVTDALGLKDTGFVHMHYDEAVAAALFFLVRSFSGDRNAGIEAFRSRAARVAGRPQPTWRQNMLVLDIGGGTTDIALLAVELTDVTPEPSVPLGGGPELTGRRFVLRPRVLGTTGHPQLGGDLLTLRMFYWLKAAIADAIRTSPAPPVQAGPDADEAGLADRVVRSKALHPVPPEVREELRRRVPTHADRNGSAPQQNSVALALGDITPAFQKLWVEMELAKTKEVAQDEARYRLGLAAEEIPADWAAELADRARQDGGVVELTSTDFERLMRPIIAAAAGLAADLVRRSIGDEPGQRLDMVALCGRTTGMPEVKAIAMEILGRELSGVASRQRAIGWDPAGVVVEHSYSKHAASIGACWAYSTNNYKGDPGADREVGIHELDIEVDRLIPVLPADFGLAGADNPTRPVPWLRAGQPFDMVDQTGNRPAMLFTRTEWRRLDQVVCLHRILAAPVMGDSYSMEWGTYDHRLARVQAGLASGAASRPGGQLWFQIEISQELRPQVWLCLGTAEGVRPVLHPDDGMDLASLARVELASLPGMARYFENGWLREVPQIDVVASPRKDDPGPAEPVRIFAREPAAQALRYDIASDGQVPSLGQVSPLVPPAAEVMPGAVSRCPLPALPAGSGPVWFHVSVDGISLPGSIAPPSFRGELPVPDAPYWALLDAQGTLRIVAGYPPYLAARSLGEMETASGHPWLAPMYDGIPSWEATWDPFTGDH